MEKVLKQAIPALAPEPEWSATPARGARECLEEPFRPDPGLLTSFVVNALGLVGSHRILEWEPRDRVLADALEARGHAVAAGGPFAAGAFDRALMVSRAFGYGGAESDALWLRALRRALIPGGLLLFHAVDRDRAWALADRLAAAADPGTDVAFDPREGRVTARVRTRGVTSDAGTVPRDGWPRRSASVRAFHLGEIRDLLARAGFELEGAWGDWDGGSVEAAGARTGRILVVASKRRRARRVRKAGKAGRVGTVDPFNSFNPFEEGGAT